MPAGGAQARRGRAQPGSVWEQAALPALILFVLVVPAGTAWAAFNLAHWTTGRALVASPVDLVIGLASGRLVWPSPTGWIALAILLLAVLTLVLAGGVGLGRRRSRSSRVDVAAQSLGYAKDMTGMAGKSARQKAQRLAPRVAEPSEPDTWGLPLGKTVVGGQLLRMSWEDVAAVVAGPRVGKTTCLTIPAVVAAPGLCIATGNKRDIVDTTRELRRQRGMVWVFDPQSLIGEEPAFWFDPLATVRVAHQPVNAARELVSHFAAATRSADAKSDAYFEPAGDELLAGVFLAASAAHEPITRAPEWLRSQRGLNEAVEKLRSGGYEQVAGSVAAVRDMDSEKQRDGIVGSASNLLRVLAEPSITRWVTPPRRGGIPQLDPASLIHSGDTVYLLSQEGPGSAGPLVAALTDALLQAGQEEAARHGRLEVPMTVVLDEAANICRIRRLPELYSHFGDRGIVLLTVLQTWSQGIRAWGKEGWGQLWSAANHKLYLGGVTEQEFLSNLSKLLGQHDVASRTVSAQKDHRSRSVTTRKEAVLDEAQLAALPPGRAVLVSSGAPPTLLATVPWWQGPQGEALRASQQKQQAAQEQNVWTSHAGARGDEH